MAQGRRRLRVVLRRGASVHALRVGGTLVAVVLVSLLAAIGAASVAAADTPWGATGSTYRSGIVCALPDGRRVALASWVVNGAAAFAVDDVVARGASYGPAPSSGTATELAPGRGLTATDLAALAYLVGHAGAGSPVQVAETSAVVARAFGGGSAQQACLGRQGTSAAGAATELLAARRLAGPYTVQVSGVQARPGSAAPVTATVLSSSGVPTPGIAVSFALDGAQAGGVTGADGRATSSITAPASAATLSATVSEPTSLMLIASSPASVTTAAARPVVGRATFVPALHPAPQLSVGGGTALVLAGGSLTPTATLTGTYGYTGTGSVTVVGPVATPDGGSCSDAAYASAPAVWTGAFAFGGDGVRAVGSTGALTPGCYAFTGSVTTTDSSPAVTANAPLDPASAVGVSALQLTQSVGSGLARTGVLTATVTATGVTATTGVTAATGAAVSSSVTTYGPLAVDATGRCDDTGAWTGAKVLSRTAAVALQPQQGADRWSAAVRTPAVTGTGCYALVASSTITQDGRSATVTAVPGATGTTVMVISPTVGVSNSAYDGRQGVPMTGTVHVTGTYGLPGRVTIGLVSAPAPATGCHGLTFPSTTTMPVDSTTVDTTGDGDYRFRTPVPGQNRCYGVVAMLAMTADSAVQVDAPAPGDTSVFLAGAVVSAPATLEIHRATVPRSSRPLAVLGAAGGVVLLVALGLVIAAVVSGERRPDPDAGALLVDITEPEPASTRG